MCACVLFVLCARACARLCVRMCVRVSARIYASAHICISTRKHSDTHTNVRVLLCFCALVYVCLCGRFLCLYSCVCVSAILLVCFSFKIDGNTECYLFYIEYICVSLTDPPITCRHTI